MVFVLITLVQTLALAYSFISNLSICEKGLNKIQGNIDLALVFTLIRVVISVPEQGEWNEAVVRQEASNLRTHICTNSTELVVVRAAGKVVRE